LHFQRGLLALPLPPAPSRCRVLLKRPLMVH
jgi:hypothetical protein